MIYSSLLTNHRFIVNLMMLFSAIMNAFKDNSMEHEDDQVSELAKNAMEFWEQSMMSNNITPRNGKLLTYLICPNPKKASVAKKLFPIRNDVSPVKDKCYHVINRLIENKSLGDNPQSQKIDFGCAAGTGGIWDRGFYVIICFFCLP